MKETPEIPVDNSKYIKLCSGKLLFIRHENFVATHNHDDKWTEIYFGLFGKFVCYIYKWPSTVHISFRKWTLYFTNRDIHPITFGEQLLFKNSKTYTLGKYWMGIIDMRHNPVKTVKE